MSLITCRNRHCPKCQTNAREKWLRTRQQELLPVGYYHLVFSVPHGLVPLIWQNKRLLFTLLFEASAATLLEVASDPKHLGAEIGFLSILHTWGQTLQPHPHIHSVVPGGGLSPDHTSWISSPSHFFLPVKVLSRVFRGKFVAGLRRAFRNQQLAFYRDCLALADPKAFGGNLNFVFGGLLVIAFSKEEGRRRRCGNGGKARAVFAKAFPNRLWKSLRRSCRRRPLSISTAVAVSTALSSVRGLFCTLGCKRKKAPGCSLEPKSRVINRLSSGAHQ